MPSRRTVRLAVAATTGLAAVAALAAPGPATAAGLKFGRPVLLTTDANFGGYEPGVVVDRFGNIVVTAHKQNHGDALSPDKRSVAGVRAMSWVWWSRDNGKTFSDMPGTTAAEEQNAEFGDEGDLTWDATGHIYFVDTSVADISFSRWKSSGKGELTLETTRPAAPTGNLDDRPWITAHGDGVVLYLGNSTNKSASPTGQAPLGGNGEAANGPGRFTAYMSYNHGDTFDSAGYTLNDSGWCRPIPDRRAGSKRFYIVCSNDTDTHWAFVTNDDGHHFTRYKMGKYAHFPNTPGASWINGAVAADGTVYAEYHESTEDKTQRVMLYTSKNAGKTWTKRDVTGPGDVYIAYSWMDVAPDGTVGVAYYGSPDKKHDWYLYAGTAKPGKKFSFTRVSPGMKLTEDGGFVWGDFFQVAFGRDSKLNVVWTTNDTLAGQSATSGYNSEIWYARQL